MYVEYGQLGDSEQHFLEFARRDAIVVSAIYGQRRECQWSGMTSCGREVGPCTVERGGEGTDIEAGQ